MSRRRSGCRTRRRSLDAERRTLRPPAGTSFQREWIDACKGKSNNVVHGTSSKTHCDFDYSGSHDRADAARAGGASRRQETGVRSGAGRVTNSTEANDYLKRQYRPLDS